MRTLLALCLGLSAVSAGAQAAPQQWQGFFKGQCELVAPGHGSLYKFPMSLEVGAPVENKADWIITYGEGATAQPRNYTLVTLDEKKGHFAVDENNGIVIDQYLFENKFVSLFEIGSSKLNASYELHSDGSLDVEIITYTFDTIREAQVGPYLVANYGGKRIQKCTLYKW
ncbi:hypothetical protein N474_22120 [Pseudoalteromonas luteoviolacea CPMOR-2]|uniref:Uncharacterized protein n=1 Tax=Pseudoalteromonas luteoviolacea DSM 6061 TaxID=1365250 RepID=A0A166V1K8_9GAMM|nr:hypothetical protein [Pseudoalteromonas luteoviolacea]KZN31622.1 hypothetical protein N475_23000 [Pseudoalteromonas luteoviolacea DSM 6061]KZN53095.1 hypothetical protein N474_22120 [Pseudoalteromonas luteoviolacea CPMOR-2]MBE0389782.1 hypothetical protein [Pseudoalteromonas luteoviolacea DSM 6061]